MEKPLPSTITMTRDCLADRQHRERGEVLAVGRDVSREHARALLDMGSATEGGEVKTRAPRKTAAAPAGSNGNDTGAGAGGNDTLTGGSEQQ